MEKSPKDGCQMCEIGVVRVTKCGEQWPSFTGKRTYLSVETAAIGLDGGSRVRRGLPSPTLIR